MNEYSEKRRERNECRTMSMAEWIELAYWLDIGIGKGE